MPRRCEYGARHEETYLEIIDGLNKEKPTPEARSPRYIIGLVYFNPGSMLATVALLACFAVVVMPSLFTVAPNRSAGLPSPSDSAPQAAVSALVERKKTPEDERTACILRYFCVVAFCSASLPQQL